MPECLNDGEGMFPHYYDPRYEQAPNPFEPGAPDLDGYLQTIAVEVIDSRLSPKKLSDLKQELDYQGILNRNVGDPAFRDAVKAILKRYKMARKVARNAYRSE